MTGLATTIPGLLCNALNVIATFQMLRDHVHDKILVRMVLLETLPEIANSIDASVDDARDAIVEALDNRQLAVPIEWQVSWRNI